MRSKDTEFAAVKLPRCLVCGGVKVEWGTGSEKKDFPKGTVDLKRI